MEKALQFINDAMTGMVFTLMVAGGVLSRYWDAPVFDSKGQTRDAKFARVVGLCLIIGALVLQVLKMLGRMALK